MKTLIRADELYANLGREDWFIFDCRFSLANEQEGPGQFREAHVPGAQYANLNEDLSAPVVPGKTGRHPLPEREWFLEKVRSWGATNDAQVIVYDEMSGAFAARLWWMFRWLGHEAVAVLDGGFTQWRAMGYPVTDEVKTVPASDFRAGEPLTQWVSAKEVLDTDATLIDARDESRYRGEKETIDPVGGHIPGAISVPFANNLDWSQGFKSPEQLVERFRQAGVPEDGPSICYCGSGVTATHNILALVHAGYPEPALYPGSWSEWITDPDRPVERS